MEQLINYAHWRHWHSPVLSQPRTNCLIQTSVSRVIVSARVFCLADRENEVHPGNKVLEVPPDVRVSVVNLVPRAFEVPQV